MSKDLNYFGTLKELKTKTHFLFDSIWRDKKMTRSQAYKWLAEKMDLPEEKCHIRYFNKWQCIEAIAIIRQFYHNKKRRIGK